MYHIVTKLAFDSLWNLNNAGCCEVVFGWFLGHLFSFSVLNFRSFLVILNIFIVCSVIANCVILNFGQLFLLIYNHGDLLTHTRTHARTRACTHTNSRLHTRIFVVNSVKAGCPTGVICFASPSCPRLILLKGCFDFLHLWWCWVNHVECEIVPLTLCLVMWKPQRRQFFPPIV